MDDCQKWNNQPEIPEFVIERDDEPRAVPASPVRCRRWLRRVAKALAVMLLVLAAIGVYKKWAYYYRLGVPVSVSPQENIEKLRKPLAPELPAVVLTTETVLDVEFDMLALHGLKASIEFAEPDTADTSVYLYSRSADVGADSVCLGSLVAQGRQMCDDRSRLGYVGMVGRNMVIGVSRMDAVKDYVLEHGGSFFRQFILVSNGTIPGVYYLHGKVERRAIGRIGDQLYYIVSRNKETFWGFADALREYGFIDAIYITGGDDYCFYRTADGQRHDIGDPADYPHLRWQGKVPLLVFRK